MLAEDKLKGLLNGLATATTEPVRDGLNDDIKRRIPQSLALHRGGWGDTINIIIDLRVSKLAAAAVIVLATVLLASIFSGRDSAGGGIYQDSKLLIKYYLRGEDIHRSDVLPQLCEALAQEGREFVYYDNKLDPENKFAVVMHWKLPDGRYGVVFGDLTTRTVSSDTLIRLQAQMLQENAR